MPSPRTVLYDLTKKGLRFDKPHSLIGASGHIKPHPTSTVLTSDEVVVPADITPVPTGTEIIDCGRGADVSVGTDVDVCEETVLDVPTIEEDNTLIQEEIPTRVNGHVKKVKKGKRAD